VTQTDPALAAHRCCDGCGGGPDSEVSDHTRPALEPLTDALRQIVEATVLTAVDDDELRRVHEELAAINTRLRARLIPGTYVAHVPAGDPARFWNSPVVGLRNAIAPPLVIERDSAGRVDAEFRLGGAYEGPPGLVHGGISALILDQLLGEAAAAGGKPGMTGTLTLRYRRGTPLGPLRASAWIDRVDGVKTYVVGHIADSEGPTVEAEGLFILPRWARGESAKDAWDASGPGRFE